MTDNTDNTSEVPVLQGTLEGGVAIPEKQHKDHRISGRLAKQPQLTKRNLEAIKQANREIALSRIDVERFVEKQVSLAYSDDTDEATTAQERVAARKWLESMAFAGDQQVRGDTGSITVNITGIGQDSLKDVVSVEGDEE